MVGAHACNVRSYMVGHFLLTRSLGHVCWRGNHQELLGPDVLRSCHSESYRGVSRLRATGTCRGLDIRTYKNQDLQL
jgi:hypothetical protein